ncbi:MAG TPA: hypothetical protein P5081_18075 [Phycisphaerae bacterium]|nr:hypothetical protein [Phycisphaerae bacterium]HRW54781.1 hypothetical protein [Phycisphaerae bacterium]
MRAVQYILLAIILATLGLWAYCAFYILGVSTRQVTVIAGRDGVSGVFLSDSIGPFSFDIDSPRESRSADGGGIAFNTMSYADMPAFARSAPMPWVSWPEISISSMDIADRGGFVVKGRFPYWLALTVLIPPWFLLHRSNRRYRRQLKWVTKGCCRSCGYDLSSNESGVCPECGAAVWTAERLRARREPTHPRIRRALELLSFVCMAMSVSVFIMTMLGDVTLATPEYATYLTDGGVVVVHDWEAVTSLYSRWRGVGFLKFGPGHPRGDMILWPEVTTFWVRLPLWPIVLVVSFAWWRLRRTRRRVAAWKAPAGGAVAAPTA